MDPTMQALLSMGGNAVMGGVVVWVVHTLLSKTLPQMEERAEARQAKLLAFCQQIITDERISCNERHNELRADHQNLVGEVQQNHREDMDAHKEARHNLANLAYAVGNERMAEALRKARSANPGEPPAPKAP